MRYIENPVMDMRCPRRLFVCDSPCSLGLLNATGEEGGCPYGVSDAASNYCWFVYQDKYPFAHELKEIARVLGLKPSEVKIALEAGLEKVKDNEGFEELKLLLRDAKSAEPIDDEIYDVEGEVGLFSRHNGKSCGVNMVHYKNKKPTVYGLSRNWTNHLDKGKFSVVTDNPGCEKQKVVVKDEEAAGE